MLIFIGTSEMMYWGCTFTHCRYTFKSTGLGSVAKVMFPHVLFELLYFKDLHKVLNRCTPANIIYSY